MVWEVVWLVVAEEVTEVVGEVVWEVVWDEVCDVVCEVVGEVISQPSKEPSMKEATASLMAPTVMSQFSLLDSFSAAPIVHVIVPLRSLRVYSATIAFRVRASDAHDCRSATMTRPTPRWAIDADSRVAL